MRVGLVQMTSGEDPGRNLAEVERLARDATARGAELIVFPENTLFMRIAAARPTAPSTGDLARLSRLTDELGVPVLLTTPVAAGARFKNATVFAEPGRPPRVVYEKMHLFDVDVPGAPPARESAAFDPGTAPAVLEVGGWRFGLSICYDLRFAALYLRYAQAVDAILVPSAFLVPTGRAHWHVLLRARAIESQCYVLAPAQTGRHRAGDETRETFGHALAVDPWGETLADLGAEPGARVVTLERARLTEVRARIPMADHRRPC